MTEDEMLDGITDSVDMSLSKLLEIVKGWVVWCDAVHGIMISLRQPKKLMQIFPIN